MAELTEEENRQELLRLAAKPWRGECTLCPYTLWFADSEDEASQIVTDHIAEKHVLVRVWPHPSPVTVAGGVTGGETHGRAG